MGSGAMSPTRSASPRRPVWCTAPGHSPQGQRRAPGTRTLEHGHAPIHLVQATLGHASVATTNTYLHARPTDSSARYLGV